MRFSVAISLMSHTDILSWGKWSTLDFPCKEGREEKESSVRIERDFLVIGSLSSSLSLKVVSIYFPDVVIAFFSLLSHSHITFSQHSNCRRFLLHFSFPLDQSKEDRYHLVLSIFDLLCCNLFPSLIPSATLLSHSLRFWVDTTSSFFYPPIQSLYSVPIEWKNRWGLHNQKCERTHLERISPFLLSYPQIETF